MQRGRTVPAAPVRTSIPQGAGDRQWVVAELVEELHRFKRFVVGPGHLTL